MQAPTAFPAERTRPRPSRETLLAVLDTVKDVCSVAAHAPLGLVEMGLITGVDISADGVVTVRMTLTSPGCMFAPRLFEAAREELSALPGVTHVHVELDTAVFWTEERIRADARERLTTTRQQVAEVNGVRPRPTATKENSA